MGIMDEAQRIAAGADKQEAEARGHLALMARLFAEYYEALKTAGLPDNIAERLVSEYQALIVLGPRMVQKDSQGA